MKIKQIVIDDIKTDYSVTDTGLVIRTCNNKILKPSISNCGYVRVTLYIKNKSGEKKPRKLSVHRLVALTFIPNDDIEKIQVNHIDGNKLNNKVSNLEWVTPSENDYKAYEIGIKQKIYGNDSHLAKYSKSQVMEACEYMEDGNLTIPEISLLTDIATGMLYRIQKRLSWVNISVNYDVENCKQPKNKYTPEQMEKVFKLLEENKLSMYDISDETAVKVSTIQNIILHRYVKNFEYLYDIYDISKYQGNKIMKSLPDEVIKDIIKLLNEGYKTKYIQVTLHNKYNINEDRLAAYTRRIKSKIK